MLAIVSEKPTRANLLLSQMPSFRQGHLSTRNSGKTMKRFKVLGVYSLLTAFFPDRVLTVSGFPLGFEAIWICILYSVLSKGYLERTVLVRRALHSVAMVDLGAVVFLAFRAGYLPNSLA